MSRPTVDYKGRRRSKTIAFRVSPEEDEVINALVAASGMTKQDYITSRLECRDINVSPNVRVYRMLRDQMRSVYVELRRLRSADGIDERLIELMQVLTRVFIDLGADELGAVGDGRNDRETMELLAVSWLAENDFAESVGVRFDKISMIVVGEDRALLRHHINAFGEA